MTNVIAGAGARVKAQRYELRMTQKQLSAKSGIAVSFLSEIELEKTDCRACRWLAIAKALEVTLQWLLTGQEWTGAWPPDPEEK